MENIGTPLDDLDAANTREIAEHRDRTDEAGCFYRFMEQFDPNNLSRFMRAEADRGVKIGQVIDGIAQGLAYHLVAVALMTTSEQEAYRDLVVKMQVYAQNMITGRHGVEVVHVAPGGVQRESTVSGLFRGAGGAT